MNGAENQTTIDTTQVRVLGFVGSLRRASLNADLFEVARSAMPAGASLELFDGLGRLPHYDEDLDSSLQAGAADVGGAEAGSAEAGSAQAGSAEAGSAEVRRLRDAVAAADALLFVTPEYNGTIPGALKNAIDWASRPAGAGALKGKPAAVIGASAGQFGGVWAQADLRRSLGIAGARVLDTEFAVPKAGEAFVHGDRGVRLADESSLGALRELVEALTEEAVRNRDARVATIAAAA